MKTSESQIASGFRHAGTRAIDVLWAWLQSRGRAEEPRGWPACIGIR